MLSSNQHRPNKTKIYRCLIIIIYLIAKFLGIITFNLHQSHQRKRVRKSRSWHIYSCCIFIMSIIAMPVVTLTICKRMTFLQQNYLLSMVGYNRYLLQQFCAIFTIYMQIRKDTRIINFINAMLRCQQRKTATALDGRALFALLIKLLTLVPVAAWTIFLIGHVDATQSFGYVLTILFIGYCHTLMQIALNMFFIGMLFIRHNALRLNQKLKELLCSMQHAAATDYRYMVSLSQITQYIIPFKFCSKLDTHLTRWLRNCCVQCVCMQNSSNSARLCVRSMNFSCWFFCFSCSSIVLYNYFWFIMSASIAGCPNSRNRQRYVCSLWKRILKVTYITILLPSFWLLPCCWIYFWSFGVLRK